MSRVVSPEKTEIDIELSKSLRPKSFSEFIGQQNIVERLFIAVKAAEERKEPVDHMIFIGEPGLGKTTLARLVGGVRMQETSALFLTDIGLGSIMCNMVIEGGSAPSLFLDELHSIKKTTAETLYPVMEDSVLHTGISATGLAVPKFTLIGATTKFGKVSQPMRDRFTHIFKMKAYSHLDISKILVISREKLNVDASDSAIMGIARRARGVPRIANRFLKIVRDYSKTIDDNVVLKAFNDIGMDANGLDETDREYLSVLRTKAKPVGIYTLSSLMAVPEEEIADIIEPWLLKQGFVEKTTKGRMITTKGIMALCSN